MDKTVEEYFKNVLGIMRDATIVFPIEAIINIYHHKGKKLINEVGATFMNIVNRDYCKSYVIMLKGQHYPNHYHRIKIESFYVLYGTLMVSLDGEIHNIEAGGMLNVDRGQDHSFWAEDDVIFEEISTKYVSNDSVYLDDDIRKITYEEKRTTINFREWKEIRKTWMQ